MSDNYNANIYLTTEDLNNIEDRIENITEECQERIFGKENVTYRGTSFQINASNVENGYLTSLEGQTSQSSTPTPTNPQPIKITTGRQVVGVCGKNLLNTNTFVKGRIDPANGNIQYPDGITDFSTTNNSITFTSNATWRGVASDFIPITTGNYYFKMSVSTTSSRLYAYVDYYDNEYNYISRLGNYSYVNGDTKTWLLNLNVQNAKFIRIHFEMQQIGTTTITNPMLDESNADYEEYKGNDYEINLGKNLFDTHSGTTITSVNVQFTRNSDGTITLNGTSNGTGFVEILYAFQNGTTQQSTPTLILDSSSTYTASFKSLSGTSSTTDVRFITQYNSTGSQATIYVGNTQTISNSDGLYRAYIRIPSGATFTDYVVGIQVEKGSIASSFTPYKTPIYLGEIGNYKDYIVKTSGKNLFDKDNTTNGIFYDTNDGHIINSSLWTQSSFIDATSGEQITIQSDYLTGNNSFLITQFDENQNWLRGQQFSLQTGKTTFTLGTNTKYIKIGYRNDRVNPNTLMVNKGTTALPYEPYGTGQWYIHKEIGRVVLNGSESGWAYDTNNQFFVISFTGYLVSGNNIPYCNYYKGRIPVTAGANVQNNEIALSADSTKLRIYAKNTSITSASAFKTWLSTHNTEVYYVLNTPTNTLIEDEELINQLESIQLITGLNNINVSSANLPTIISIYKYFSNALRNIQVGDNLSGKTLYLSFPRTIYESIPDTDTSTHMFIAIATNNTVIGICYKYYLNSNKAIGVRVKDDSSETGYIIKYLYSYSLTTNNGNPYLNFVRFTLPLDYGVVTSIDANSEFYQYVKIYDESIIPNYTKHTWVDNELLTMQKIDNIERGVRNIGFYYEKPNGWVQEKEWLPDSNKNYAGNYGVGIKTISYQDLNRWYNNLDLIDFSDLNNITIWNAKNDITQLTWNEDSDVEWVDGFITMVSPLIGG